MESTKCWFCGRPKNEVAQLVTAKGADGEGPAICNRCVMASAEMLTTTGKKKGFDVKAEEDVVRTPKEIKAYLDEYVIGQEKAKRDLAIAVHNHYKRRKTNAKVTISTKGESEDVEIEKSNILLLGPSGSGKTYLARSIARMLQVPFFVGDATRLTQAGYVGDDVETLLQGLVQEANGDVQKAEWGIIFIDEIDKVARKSGKSSSGYRDVSGEGVQQALLKILEGTKVMVPRSGRSNLSQVVCDAVDTTNILFICAGSFSGIEPLIEKRLNSGSGIGFGSGTKEKVSTTKTFLSATEEDVIEFGVIPEMAGRLPVLTTTIDLTEDDLVRVLVEPRHSVLKQFKALFSLDGIQLDFTDGALRAVAREAKGRPTGARALRSIVESALRDTAFDSPGENNIGSILVTEEAVTGKGSPVLTPRQTKKASRG